MQAKHVLSDLTKVSIIVNIPKIIIIIIIISIFIIITAEVMELALL